MRSIITISREFGSGGREIGKKLADDLGIPFYDKELLEMASKESGICQELFVKNDESYTNSFLFWVSIITKRMAVPFFSKTLV